MGFRLLVPGPLGAIVRVFVANWVCASPPNRLLSWYQSDLRRREAEVYDANGVYKTCKGETASL